MAAIVGSGAISIFPVMPGIKRKISNEFGAAGAAGAKRFDQATRGVGLKAGKTIGSELKNGIKTATTGMETPGLTQLRRDVTKASEAVNAARLKQLGTAAQVKTAEDQLAKTIARHGSDSKQAEAATLRLEAAQLRHRQAAETLNTALNRLETSQASLTAVQQQAEASTKTLGQRILGMFANFKAGFTDVEKSRDAATGLAGAFGGLTRAITGPAINAIDRFHAGWANASMAMLDGAGIMGQIGGKTRSLANTITSTVSKWGSIIAKPFRNGAKVAGQFGSDLAYGLNQRLAPIRNSIGTIATTVTAPFRTVGNAIGGYLAPIASAVGNVFSKLSPIASTAVNGIKNAFDGIGETIKAKMAGIGESVKGLATLSVGGLAAGVSALGTALVGVGKSALSAYASYEQAVGGIDTLFKDASGTVQQFAADAYRTAGVGAADYMSQITSFSASLISSLGGDTAQAAQLGNQAMIDMSDNANKMGTSLDSIQETYQSLARGNYQMLDNLKLGYGGTKTEMERLISDANKLPAVLKEGNSLSADSFADVVEAISRVQKNLGISGTTAREAASTIEGSVGSMKAAWANWLTELGKDNADMGKLTNQLVTSLGTAMKNVIPRIGVIAKSLIASLPSMFSEISQILPAPIQQALTAITGFASQFKSVLAPISAAFVALGVSGIVPLLAKIPLLGGVLGGLAGPLSLLGGPLGMLITSIGALIATSPRLQAVFGAGLQTVFKQVDTALQPVQAMFQTLGTTLSASLTTIMPLVESMVEGLITSIVQLMGYLTPLIPTILTPLLAAIQTLIPPISQLAAAILPMITNLIGQLTPLFGMLITTVIQTIGQLMPIVQNVATLIGTVITTLIIPTLQSLMPIVSMVIGTIIGLIGQLMPIIQSAASLITQIISGLIIPVIQTVLPVVNMVISAIIGYINGALLPTVQAMLPYISGVINAINAVIRGIISIVQGVINVVQGIISGNWGQVWDGFKQIVSGAVQALGGILAGIKDTVLGVFAGAGTWLWDSGKAIIDGLIGGIKSMIGAAGDAISGVMDAISSFLPHSPAKRGAFSGRGWSLYSGRAIMTGLATGITQRSGLAQQAIDAAMRRAAAATSRLQNAYQSVTTMPQRMNVARNNPNSVQPARSLAVNTTINATGLDATTAYAIWDLRTRNTFDRYGGEA